MPNLKQKLRTALDRTWLGYPMTDRTEPFVRQIYESGTMLDQEGNTVTVHGHIHPEQGERLYSLALSTQPKTTLEVGMAYGLSSLYICRALGDSGGQKHIVIDPNESSVYRQLGMWNLQCAGYGDLTELYEERSEECLPRLVQQGVQLDFAFIDGWHTFDYTLVDFYFIHRMLRVDGIVVFHDCQLPAIRRVVRFAQSHRDYEVLAWKRGWRRLLHQTLIDVAALLYLALTLKNPWHYRSPGVQLVALRKRSDKEPPWNFYRPF
jgi:predicted O-methyltransferase YrrM